MDPIKEMHEFTAAQEGVGTVILGVIGAWLGLVVIASATGIKYASDVEKAMNTPLTDEQTEAARLFNEKYKKKLFDTYCSFKKEFDVADKEHSFKYLMMPSGIKVNDFTVNARNPYNDGFELLRLRPDYVYGNEKGNDVGDAELKAETDVVKPIIQKYKGQFKQVCPYAVLCVEENHNRGQCGEPGTNGADFWVTLHLDIYKKGVICTDLR